VTAEFVTQLLFKPGPGAGPVPKQVPLGEDELEGRPPGPLIDFGLVDRDSRGS
jgi:hypothetical protein